MNRTLLVALVCASLCACAAPNSPPPSPTAASTAPSATGAPTAAPSPSMTPTTAPSATPSPEQAVRDALRTTSDLTSYRIQFTVNLRITPEGGTAQDQTFLDFTGAFQGADVAFEQRDPTTASADARIADGTLRVVTVDGQTYAFGPLPVDGADQAAWYAFGERAPSATRPMFGAHNTLDMLFKKIDLAQLQLDGEDTIDGQACERYQGGEHVALRFVDSLGTPTTPEMIEREKLPVEQRLREDGISYREPDARLWVCTGLLRRIDAGLTLLPTGVPQSVGYTLSLAITEPNGDFVVAAPEKALRLDEERATSGELTAVVFNSGNVREAPSMSGEVLDQINARETVILLARTADGRWFRVTNVRGVTGWVSSTLLTIDPATAEATPVE